MRHISVFTCFQRQHINLNPRIRINEKALLKTNNPVQMINEKINASVKIIYKKNDSRKHCSNELLLHCKKHLVLTRELLCKSFSRLKSNAFFYTNCKFRFVSFLRSTAMQFFSYLGKFDVVMLISLTFRAASNFTQWKTLNFDSPIFIFLDIIIIYIYCS